MILAQPARFQGNQARLCLFPGLAHKNFLQFGESFRKIGQQFRGNFPFVAARAKNARYLNPSWSF
jgi:hypothetical protein